MPYAAKRPCTRCGKLGQCVEHTRSPAYAPKIHEQPRQKTAARGYGSKWQSARAGYLRRHPLCVLCEALGEVVAADVVDHIIPHRGDRLLFWDSAGNWQALCVRCHNRKTAGEESYRGVDGKWGTSQRT